MRVKICGITNADDARAAATLGVEYIGLIRAASPRQVSATAAREIAAVVAPPTQPVLLYRDAAVPDMLAEVAQTGIGCVQLHGREGVTTITALRAERPDLRIIKAIAIANDGSASELTTFVTRLRDARITVDFILLDAPKEGAHPSFHRIGRISRRALSNWPPLWLAGGLTFDNVVEAVGQGQYVGVDVARGVESAPGRKDPLLLERFVARVRAL